MLENESLLVVSIYNYLQNFKYESNLAEQTWCGQESCHNQCQSTGVWKCACGALCGQMPASGDFQLSGNASFAPVRWHIVVDLSFFKLAYCWFRRKYLVAFVETVILPDKCNLVPLFCI